MSSLPIANLLKQTVFVSRYIRTSNEYGDESFDNPEELRARIEYVRKLAYSSDGTSYSSVATIYIDVDVPDKSLFFVPKYNDVSVEDFPDVDSAYVQGLLDYMKYNTDLDYSDAKYWEYIRLIQSHSKPALSINHYHDGYGVFSHCEVSI